MVVLDIADISKAKRASSPNAAATCDICSGRGRGRGCKGWGAVWTERHISMTCGKTVNPCKVGPQAGGGAVDS